VKWIFRYLRGSSKSCLSFCNSKPVLEGYTDADMAGDLDGRKSTSGYLFTFAGGLYHGSQNCRSVLPYLQLRLGILQRMKQVKKCFGPLDETISPRIGFDARQVCSSL